ncbi:MAG: hypothetical protein HEEMFOPI_02053 [Holosporales bacterium]
MKKYIALIAFLSSLCHDQAHSAQRIFTHQARKITYKKHQLPVTDENIMIANEVFLRADFIYVPEHVKDYPFELIVNTDPRSESFIMAIKSSDFESKNTNNTIAYLSALPFFNPDQGWRKPLLDLLNCMGVSRSQFSIIANLGALTLRQIKPKEIEIFVRIVNKIPKKEILLEEVMTNFYSSVWDEPLLESFEKNMNDLKETDIVLLYNEIQKILNKTFKEAVHRYKPQPKKQIENYVTSDFFTTGDFRNQKWYGSLSGDAKIEISQLINEIFSNFEIPQSYIDLYNKKIFIKHDANIYFSDLYKLLNAERIYKEESIVNLFASIRNYVEKNSLYDSFLTLNTMARLSCILPGRLLMLDDILDCIRMVFEKEIGLAHINYLILNIEILKNNGILNRENAKKMFHDLLVIQPEIVRQEESTPPLVQQEQPMTAHHPQTRPWYVAGDCDSQEPEPWQLAGDLDE